MIEIPEASNLAKQLNESVAGKIIKSVTAGYTPHKFAWFHGEPSLYDSLLRGRIVGLSQSRGGYIHVSVEDDISMLFGEGGRILLHSEEDKRPQKHQLLIELDDGSALSVSIQGYGLVYCAKTCEINNKYYDISCSKPSPLLEEFDKSYFLKLLSEKGNSNISAKAFLATEQRIPGLGNGVLQDVLFAAKIHPKRKMNSLTDSELDSLYSSVKNVLSDMALSRGRDTEIDLYGNLGGYRTMMSKNTVGSCCPSCGNIIEKMAYMGGSVYFCVNCQPL
ncbi:MAG: DNA-formamidopyrimidine glycosylase family protein [Bacillota bacterium]